MYIDAQTEFSAAQVVTESCVSTNTVVSPVAGPTSEGARAMLLISNVAVGTTLRAEVQGSLDEDFTEFEVLGGAEPVLPAAGKSATFYLGISPARVQFYRLAFTIGGADPSVTITAALVVDAEG